ncbi:MAG: hypothetical protein AMS21_01090 [Gemmatimonas sp. SG8_38_2]|nr:MAG: hypothetical protein AMS21_01090 [Gemmatimonas sp. SG8_38_2]
MRLEIWGERWLLMGRPKVGKSTLAASFPKPLAINLDGAGNKYVFGVDSMINAYTYEDCVKAIGEAKKRQGWETLILDPVDKFVTFLNRFVAKTCKKETIADVAHGRGYAKQVALFKQYLEDFWAIAESRSETCASIIIAHSKKGECGESLTIRDRLHSYIQGGVNNIVYCYKQRGEGNNLSFHADLSGSENVEAGCRNPVLQGAGCIPASFKSVLALFGPDGASMDKAYGWLVRKGGVDQAGFISWCNDQGMITDIEKYEYIRLVRENAAMLENLKKKMAERSQ